jgi:XTP/dITP diphosphohydrolase
VQLLVATTNPNKLREIRPVLARLPLELITLADLPAVAEPEETGETFEANAQLKALYYARVAPPGVLTVAEDSGLVIDALDGDPGVRSARFLRPDATYPERFEEIYRRLEASRDRPPTARFVCAVAVARPDALLFETRGVIEGAITRPPRGARGFGYDPIFLYPASGRTLAEVTDEEKQRVAHRGKAFEQLAQWLASSMGTHEKPGT